MYAFATLGTQTIIDDSLEIRPESLVQALELWLVSMQARNEHENGRVGALVGKDPYQLAQILRLTQYRSGVVSNRIQHRLDRAPKMLCLHYQSFLLPVAVDANSAA